MLIVDVFNVLHASGAPGSPWVRRLRPADLREALGISRWRSERVVLVYDGTGGQPPDRTLRRSVDAGIDLPAAHPGITEVYARAGGSDADADRVIESLLEREDRLGRGSRSEVVSSDGRVRAAAVAVRAKVLRSEEFLRLLADDVRKRLRREDDADGGRPDFARDVGMDPGRTAYWLRELGMTTGTGPKTPQDCGPEVNPDDLDTGKILEEHDERKKARHRDRR